MVFPKEKVLLIQKLNTLFTRYNSTSSYQYLQKSLLPTNKFQRSLPRLPIPELNKTCQRYLDALKPIIVSQQQYEETVNIVKQFENGEGLKLHSQLCEINKQNKHTSYISEPWFDMYLKSRLPLPLNYNPFLAWKPDPNPIYNDQIIKASNMIISALRFRRSLVEEKLEPEVFHLNPKKSNTKFYKNVMRFTPNSIATYVSFAFKAFPLDMSQYGNLFASTRVPKINRDELSVYPQSKHIAILKNGQFYVFDVLDSNGDIKEPSDIFTCLKFIAEQPKVEKESITFLTTDNRDVWARVRGNIIDKSSNNKNNIELIDSAQFILCLDDFSPKTLIEGAHVYLHGNNKNSKYLNRWFDKSFSLILSNDGNAAINFEHSWGDGVAVLRFFNEIFDDTTKRQNVHQNTPLNKNFNLQNVKRLDFDLDETIINSINSSREKFFNATNSLQLDTVQYEKMNRDYFKRKKLSPDSMFQLGFQLAYFRTYNSPAPTYESCSTAVFKHGRTETVRAATVETKTASLEILKNNTPTPQLRTLLDSCSKKHMQLTKEAAMGQGFDRHLFALKVIAEKSNNKLPPLFTDKSYTEANTFILSTSTLYGEAFVGGGFAPVINNGFGCGYGYVDNTLGLLVSSYAPHRNGKQFADAFHTSLDHIYKILEKY